LVLSGAVKEEEVLRLAKKYLEPIPRQEPPAAPRTKEPEQLGERRATVRKAAQAPLLAVGYHAPPASHADSPALELLARLLTRGRSSRLYRRLVDREQLVLNVQSIDAKSLDPGLLIFMAQARPGRDPAAAEKSMYEELDRLGREPVDDAEIQKTRNQMLVEFYREIRTIAGKANLIGTAEVLLGDHRRINSLVPMYEKVTAADLQRVAKQYLTEKNRTVVTLLPENGAGK
jgi:zinc protease